MAHEPLTPDRRRQMTRRYLLDAAAEVFAAHGFHGATLDQVAATAGFTKGAVYSNFKNKDELFLALLDDRIERQFAVVTEVMQADDAGAAPVDRLPRVRELLRAGAFFWEDTWTALYLEFVVYSLRNPEARAKLAASAERSRATVQELFDDEHLAAGVHPARSSRELAEISLALFAGLGVDRMIDPGSVTAETIDVTLDLLSGVQPGPEIPGAEMPGAASTPGA